MYGDSEDASDVDEDFFNALALLRSTEDDSAEKLRRMLDTSIENRYGFDKTLMARMPRRFLQNTKNRGKSMTIGGTETLPRKRCAAATGTGSLRSLVASSNAIESDWKPMKTFHVDVEDYSEKGDIPRISIPDEGSADGLLCKVCNGAKIGPLILLECQECQEVYHPLCHQPPVVDIDVYDPRIVWRCKKCTDAAHLSPVVAHDERRARRSRVHHNDVTKLQRASANVDKLGKLNGDPLKNETDISGETLYDIGEKSGSVRAEETLPNKGPLRLTHKIVRAATSNQLRKRIGSKLSVTRSIVK